MQSIPRLLALVLGLLVLTGSPTSAAWQVVAGRAPDGHAGAAGERAVVLGGGGLTGQAWQIGLLKGLRDAGIDLTQADLVIGNSGGSVAATQMRSGRLDEFYAGLLGPAPLDSALADIDVAYFQETARMWQGVESTPGLRIAVGARALVAPQVISEDEFIARSVVRVGVEDWPSLPLQITAVDVFDGTLTLIDQSYGVPVAQAVAASTAQPGLAAPITIGASRYMDGGVAGSPVIGAAVALGHRRIVALTPGGTAAAERTAEAARAQGAEVLLLTPDAEAAQARGPDSQDPSRMPANAEAGLRQAGLMAPEVAAFWNGSTSGR